MNPIFLRALLAALPVLGLSVGAGKGLAYGAVGGGLLLGVTLLFLGIRSAFPPPVRRLSFFLLLFVTTVIAGNIFSLSALLAVSLCFLTLPDVFREKGDGRRVMGKALGASFSFWVILTGYGIFTEFLALNGSLGLFQLPTGGFFLAGLVLSLFPKKRGAR